MKVLEKEHENLESVIDWRRKEFNWGENPKWYLPGKCTVTINVCDSEDFTKNT